MAHAITLDIAAGLYSKYKFENHLITNEEFLLTQSKALDLLLWLMTHWEVEIQRFLIL